MKLQDEAKCLLLKIERALVERANLKTLLDDANATVAGHRRDLRNIRELMKRAPRSSPARRTTAGKSSIE